MVEDFNSFSISAIRVFVVSGTSSGGSASLRFHCRAFFCQVVYFILQSFLAFNGFFRRLNRRFIVFRQGGKVGKKPFAFLQVPSLLFPDRQLSDFQASNGETDSAGLFCRL